MVSGCNILIMKLAEEVSMLKLGIRTITTVSYRYAQTTSANTTKHISANRSTTYCSKKKIQLTDRMAAALRIFSYKRYEMCLASLPSQSSKANETVGGERDMTPLLHMKPKFSKD
jgi:hypothetical protein